MNSPDWKELERLWQDSPVMAPVNDIIARQRRRRWLTWVFVFLEIVTTILGAIFAVWIMSQSRPNAALRGAGLLVLVLVAGAVTLWARWPRRASNDSVTSALDEATHRTRVSVRLALASFWVTAAVLVVTGALAFLPTDAPQRRILALGALCIYLGILQAGVLIYYLRRSRELARLEEIRRSLVG